MWIKRSLVIIPILLLVFLAQSFFWAPSNESAADNEGRQNRLIFYMGGDPFNMNPWSSTTSTTSPTAGPPTGARSSPGTVTVTS